MPGFPALGTTAGARLSEKPAPIRSRGRACSGAGGAPGGRVWRDSPRSRVPDLLGSSPKRLTRCLLPIGCSPGPTLRGVPTG